MLKDSASSLHGNNRFEGFGIDLIHELSLIEGFNYTFVIREDKANGSKNKTTGIWSGMIGDVMYYVGFSFTLYQLFSLFFSAFCSIFYLNAFIFFLFSSFIHHFFALFFGLYIFFSAIQTLLP